MQKQRSLSEKIKLPSNWMLVNPDSIWKFLVAISKTGNVFNKDQLIKTGLYTSNDDNISRNLSYLKYLGIIEEERGKDKDQRFKVLDKGSIKNILYELKAGREQDAKRKLKEHLQGHPLFQTLKDEFFKSDNTKTLHELEHFLKDGIPGKGPQYYQKGGEVLIKILSLVSLAHLNGNEIKFDNQDDEAQDAFEIDNSSMAAIITQDEKKAIVPIQKTFFEEAQIIPSEKYLVRFTGPGMNAEYEIQEEDDLVIVEATLAKIKKKLKSSESN